MNWVDYTGYNWQEEFAAALIIFYIVPILVVDQKLRKLGLGYIFDYATEGNITMGVDEKSGVLVYNFFITHRVSDSNSFKESYYFSYFLGDYDVWDRYIKNIEKNKFINATSSL